jgi:hypothetical protein
MYRAYDHLNLLPVTITPLTLSGRSLFPTTDDQFSIVGQIADQEKPWHGESLIPAIKAANEARPS